MSYLVHSGVLVKAVNIPCDIVDHTHGVKVGECSLSTPQPACQQLDYSLKKCNVTCYMDYNENLDLFPWLTMHMLATDSHMFSSPQEFAGSNIFTIFTIFTI